MVCNNQASLWKREAVMILKYFCRSAFVFWRFTVTMEKSRTESHSHVCGSFDTAISWWKGRVVLVALELLWGLKITSCQAAWLVFTLAHFSPCLHRLLLASVPLKLSLLVDLCGDLLWTVLLKIKKEKAKKDKKQGFPCAEVSFVYFSERLLHSRHYVFFPFKPWWITRSLIYLISEITHSLWIPGCHLATLTLQEGKDKAWQLWDPDPLWSHREENSIIIIL